VYNWEFSFHFLLTIAVHLSKNQRFAEAQRFFHYIFDPTNNDAGVPAPQRFWRFLAFRYGADTTPIDQQLALLSAPDEELKNNPGKQAQKQAIIDGYNAIRDNPFHPHLVATTRPLAYQYAVVMRYLDNLIAWGDSLFRQDTIESLNEATQIYVLAANLLGEKPQRIPSRGTVKPKTFAELKASGFDKLGNTWVELEGAFPLSANPAPAQPPAPDASGPLFGIGRTLYFCLPPNEKLLGYWDTVADRLFKIRHCMNIEGVVRQLALFDPPLDPGMLVKAAAAGIDIGSILNGLNQPIGPVRCTLLIQKALELCAEVRNLGGALLSAIEKGDAEAMALLRQSHEIKVQTALQDSRFLQWQHARQNTEALLKTRASALEKYTYYQRALGLTPDKNAAPDKLPLLRNELTEENFDEAFSELIGQYDKTIAAQAYPPLSVIEQGTLFLNMHEHEELNELLPGARDKRELAFSARQIAPVFSLLPDFPINIHFWGIGGTIIFGGSALTANVQTGADIVDMLAQRDEHDANRASKKAVYQRRADEWMLQSNLAARELMQIGRQIMTSLIAEQIARHDYELVKKQIAQSQEIDQFLHDKFTNQELYAWMQGEISRLYYEYYRFAFDTARRAERTMKREVMRPELDATDYIKFNYWDGGRRGLLAAEALHLDIKRMEMAYYEHNTREFEITRHVSLRQLNPDALLTLKATSVCEVTVPEWLLDLGCPGHYMRRLKHASISHPAVTGPFTGLNCTLSLLKSSVRKSPALSEDGYARTGSEDTRFVDYVGTTTQIVTSRGDNDGGMFETNLRDDRMLPFEGSGAISTWRIELPAAFPQFDYNTISDVVLHLRYTARQGGQALADAAVASLTTLFEEASSSSLALLFSLRHEFSNEWHQFVSGTANFAAIVKRDYFPYFTSGRTITVDAVELHAVDTTQHELTSRVAMGPGLGVEVADDAPLALSFPAETGPDAVLVRDASAYVFVVVKYTLS
jgi:hypothetical protein